LSFDDAKVRRFFGLCNTYKVESPKKCVVLDVNQPFVCANSKFIAFYVFLFTSFLYLCRVKKNSKPDMKKLLVIVIVLLVAVLMALTVPDKQAHKEAMMKAVEEYVSEEAESRFGDNVLTNLGKNVAVKTIELALNSKLQVHNYLLWNTTSVHLKDKDQLLSVGMFSHVFTFDKEMLREKLEESLKAKEEAASEKEAAKENARELKRLEREKKKREKELAREQKRLEKEAAREQKRQEKEARKKAKEAEKEAKRRAKENA